MSSDEQGKALKRGYFGNVVAAAKTTAEGMAVTLAQYFRRPTTVQYPDRTSVPVSDSLPERYRGFLEVDMDICTACKACERDCPINVIAIDIEKVGDQRVMTRFDIDMGKCMYCGICVESCPTDAHAPGDDEQTKCIRMTREFEGATSDFPTLTFRFIRPGDFVVPFKPKKGRAVEIEIPRASEEIHVAYHQLAGVDFGICAEMPKLRSIFANAGLAGSVTENLERIKRTIPLFASITNVQLRDFVGKSTLLRAEPGRVITRRNTFSSALRDDKLRNPDI